MNERSADWDWVSERAKCSTRARFSVLRELAKRDVASRNSTLGNERYAYREGSSDKKVEVAFTVWDMLAGIRRAVEFELHEDEITISSDPPEWSLLVTLTLSDDGYCKFSVGADDSLDAWQVMRRALEALFFTRS